MHGQTSKGLRYSAGFAKSKYITGGRFVMLCYANAQTDIRSFLFHGAIN
jgi:hypothetical protein